MAIKGGKLTPYLLNRGDDMCPRRLAREFRSEDGTKDFFSRWRVRDTLLAALEEAHVESRAPTADHLNFSAGADELRSEEALVLLGAATGYCEFFRDRPAASTTYEAADAASIKLGGAIDLVLTGQAGVELRQLELWRRSVCASPFDSWELDSPSTDWRSGSTRRRSTLCISTHSRVPSMSTTFGRPPSTNSGSISTSARGP